MILSRLSTKKIALVVETVELIHDIGKVRIYALQQGFIPASIQTSFNRTTHLTEGIRIVDRAIK